jgi:predicted  nucleic acid-binding Zn-ribbon protein
MKLTLNQAAKDCGRAKSTISKAIKTGKLSHEKGDKGAFLIDQSELYRVFPPTSNEQSKIPVANSKNEQRNSALQVELDAIRRELETANLERTREREQLTDQIQELRETVAEQRADFRQTLAVITDQRAGQGGRRFFGLLPAKSV